MELFWILLGALLILLGVAGAILSVVPGLPFSYAGLLMLQFTAEPPFTLMFFVWWAIIVIVVMFLESVIPAAGAKKFGGSRLGITGCLAGAVLGFIFFPPAGIIFGSVIGAFAGEIAAGKKPDQAIRASFGSLLGFLAGTVIKVITALIMAFYFFTNI